MKRINVPEKSARKKKAMLKKLVPFLDDSLREVSETSLNEDGHRPKKKKND